jgi:glycosyltransferase involved in cell wall biosynthesis
VLHFRRLYSLVSESFLHELIGAIERRGAATEVATLVRLNADRRPRATKQVLRFPARLRARGGLAHAAGRGLGMRESDRVLWPLLRPWLRWRVRRFRPDVLLAHFGSEGVFATPVARAERVPLAVGFYGYDVSRLARRPRWRARYRRVFDEARLLIGISNHVLERLSDLGAPDEKLVRLPLGTDVARFAYRDPSADYDGGTVRCLHVGRLTAKKGPLELVRAFAEARRRLAGRVQLELRIAGDGELALACRREVRALGLEGAVELLGAVPHARVPELLSQAHLYVQHCRTAPDGDMEGLGVTFVEASAAGLPIVSTRHDGIPEVVLDGTSGRLSPPGDVAAMAANLAALATEPSAWGRMGRAGRAHVEAHFALPEVAERWERALRSATERSAGSAGRGEEPVRVLVAAPRRAPRGTGTGERASEAERTAGAGRTRPKRDA